MKQVVKRALKYIFGGVPKHHVNVNVAQVRSGETLLGKNILITGGNRGIGLEMAKKMSMEGANVVISGRNIDQLQDIAEKIHCRYIQLNVDEVETFVSRIQEVAEMLGGLDCLINNAGISLHERSFFDVTPESWDMQMTSNLRGPYFLTQAFMNYLVIENKRGNILFISSETGETADNRPYGYTKAAINSMVRGLAHLYKNHGIRVNALAPGITASDMTGVSESNLYAGTYGQGRFYLPKEMAEVAAFLLSDLSDCISGQIITCNNAQT